jgi:hypothetical protein
MYQNSLSDLLDAIGKNKVWPHEEIPAGSDSMALEVISSIQSTAKDAVCFCTNYESVPEIEIVKELARLPFKRCWFEFDLGDGAKQGFFCEEIPGELLVTMFVKAFSGRWIFFGVYVIKFSNGNTGVRAAGPWGDTQKSAFHYLFMYLTALNCCNIKRIEHKPKPSQQSVRRALGRHPLFSTWTLEIDLQRTEQEMPGQGGTHASPRLHLRRGHARQHRPGQWCWVQPHVVGDKSLGMIHKDYASH